MQKGRVFRNKIYAGILTKVSNKEYIFQYDKEYLIKDDSKAISLNFSLQEKVFNINTAACGIIKFSDGQNAYITKRFDYDETTSLK